MWVLKIEGCDYIVSKKTLAGLLSYFGEVLSEMMENLFHNGGELDSETNGTNRSAINLVKIKLNKDILQMISIMGRRIKDHCKGIHKLCTHSFGPHPKHAVVHKGCSGVTMYQGSCHLNRAILWNFSKNGTAMMRGMRPQKNK
jgi:hypothetical protein